MFVMIGTRPDIAYGVILISRFMSNPSKDHKNAVKWLLRYLKGLVNLGLVFRLNKEGGNKREGYCDSDYTTNLDKKGH